MNLIDAIVVEVLREPYQLKGVPGWLVDVLSESEGHTSKTFIGFKTKEEALAVKEGYTFQC